jgi:hypothetical protein
LISALALDPLRVALRPLRGERREVSHMLWGLSLAGRCEVNGMPTEIVKESVLSMFGVFDSMGLFG